MWVWVGGWSYASEMSEHFGYSVISGDAINGVRRCMIVLMSGYAGPPTHIASVMPQVLGDKKKKVIYAQCVVSSSCITESKELLFTHRKRGTKRKRKRIRRSGGTTIPQVTLHTLSHTPTPHLPLPPQHTSHTLTLSTVCMIVYNTALWSVVNNKSH